VFETTALGAATLAGLALGMFRDMGDLKAQWAMQKEFLPQKDDAWRSSQLKQWHKAVSRTRGWAAEE
jgi:glycerol kinase